MSASRRALVITFDHFPASILGCYGNEWIETPHLDRVAAIGVVGDACMAASIDSTSISELFAVGQNPDLSRGLVIQESASLIDFSTAGFQTVETIDGEHGPTAKPDRIPLAEMVRRAKSVWQAGRHELVWLHARGVSIPTSPPTGFAELYQDEFEDRGLEFAQLADEERAVHPLVTAGWASLLDHWLGELLSGVIPQAETLILITAARGAVWQPWPNSFGPFDHLRSQAVHVPWIMSAANVLPQSHRISEPLSTRRLGTILTEWFKGVIVTPGSTENSVITRKTDATRITTQEWSAIFPHSSGLDPLLFARPEDFWEVNNLATIAPGAIEKLQQLLASNKKPGS